MSAPLFPDNKNRYNAVCRHCGKAKYVWLETMVGAAPVFCVCGAIMELSSQAPIVSSSPQASNVRRVEVPPAELCTLGMMTLPNGNHVTRQFAFEAIMREAFVDESGLPGYKEI